MGVLRCDRADCENIMCDRYSEKYGYICDDCFQELVASGIIDINYFMNISKKNARKEELEKIFKERSV